MQPAAQALTMAVCLLYAAVQVFDVELLEIKRGDA
jgi:hypothetical protein